MASPPPAAPSPPDPCAGLAGECQAGTDLAARRGYHHGNLREALLEAARRLTAERGPHGFTLAEAARLAGVSASAPYRHFRDKEALLAELSQRGFTRFGARLREALAQGRPPREGLAAMGSAYLAFAREEPGYYGAMFAWGGAPLAGRASGPGAATAVPAAGPGPRLAPGSRAAAPALAQQAAATPLAASAPLAAAAPVQQAAAIGPVAGCAASDSAGADPFATLVGAIADLLPPGRQRDSARLLALEVWALSHGIAGLERAGLPGPGSGAPTPEAVLADAVARLIRAG